MKYLSWIILIIGCIGCKSKTTSIKKVNQHFKLNECFPYQAVDSIVIYYMLGDNEYYNRDSNGIKFIQDTTYNNQLSRNTFNIYDVSLFDTLYENKVLITNKDSINKLQSIFTPVPCPEEQYETDCEPFYRDVILFYKNNIVVGGIKICFSCKHIVFNKQDRRNQCFIYSNQYKILSSYFTQNIHSIIY